MSRFYRSTREAFPCERFPATFGPYRRVTFGHQIARVVGFFCLIALLGVIAGWGA